MVARSTTDPIFDAQQNISGSLNIILNCIRFKVTRMIYASSGGAVYGEPQYLPVDENHLVKTISPYGVSKYAVEHYLRLYGVQYGLDYVVLRYTNVYGPRQDPNGESGVVAIFTHQMLNGEQPTIFGSGDKTRDYIHVSDVVRANLLAMQRGYNEIYNISTGIETSDGKMFKEVAKLLDYTKEPIYMPVRPGEVYHICLEAAKAKRELGWQPRMPLREGLLQTIGYYRKPT